MTDEEFASRLSDCALGAERGTFPAGAIFGDWRITAFVAKGGAAEVYCAEHTALGTPAAVKVLAEPLTDSRKARFLREAKLLAEIKSSAFPAFYGYGEANGRPYLAEELLEPGDLPTGDGPRAKFLLALCAGLKTLHACGIVHRDIKPANILFRKNGEPVIVDLGLAKSVNVPLVPDGVSIVDGKAVGVGTPEYAAPEQFTGGDITPAADIHALGVLTKKLVALSPNRNRRGDDIPVAACWRNIIRRATSSIASERYQSVDELATAIRRRHWLRNCIVAVLSFMCVANLATVIAFLPRTKGDPFTAQFRYEGTDAKGRRVYGIGPQELSKNVYVDERVTLRGPALYKITGPGRLTANIDGTGDVEVEIQRGTLHNYTDVPLKNSSIKYSLKGNAFLILSRLRKESVPDKLVYNPAFDYVTFGLGE